MKCTANNSYFENLIKIFIDGWNCLFLSENISKEFLSQEPNGTFALRLTHLFQNILNVAYAIKTIQHY